jgi:GNAT superfamily N-acetyltransferase
VPPSTSRSAGKRADQALKLKESLSIGIEYTDRAGASIRYRYFHSTDNVEEITDMLHEAYAPLALSGMKFVASHQDSMTTRKRIEKGETIVATDRGRLIGIVTLSEVELTRGSPFYDRDDVASFGQFAVRPSYQRRGIGAKLMALVEERAREKGVLELALDTSERAESLIALYQAKGFRFIEYVQWKSVNYRSMIFSKTLGVE